MIQEILESTRSSKRIKRNMAIGKTWITFLKDNERKVYSRKGIIEIATEYYKEMYSDEDKNDTNENVKKNESDEEIPEIMENEVESIVKKLKIGKAAGPDNIYNEHIKYGGKKIIKYLTKMFNEIIINGKTPDEWGLSDIITIHKKGDKHNIENYRPLSLGSNTAKIFTKIITNRIKNTLEAQQPTEQAGFRRNFSTIDHLFTINQLIQKCEEYNIEVYLLFIDYTKAFDSVKHRSVIEAMKDQGIEKKIHKNNM